MVLKEKINRVKFVILSDHHPIFNSTAVTKATRGWEAFHRAFVWVNNILSFFSFFIISVSYILSFKWGSDLTDGTKNDSNNVVVGIFWGFKSQYSFTQYSFFLVLLSWELIIAHIAECEHFLLEVSMCVKTDDSSPWKASQNPKWPHGWQKKTSLTAQPTTNLTCCHSQEARTNCFAAGRDSSLVLVMSLPSIWKSHVLWSTIPCTFCSLKLVGFCCAKAIQLGWRLDLDWAIHFQSFCCRFAAVLVITVRLHVPVLAKP